MTRRLSILVAGVLLTASLLAVTAGTASANPPYYNNSSRVVDADSPSNATLDNIVDLAVSLTPSIIGSGEQDPSNTGFQGVLLTGLMWGSVAVGMMIGAGVGPIGGGVVASIMTYGLVDAGYAPQWLRPVLLFGIGIFAYIAIRRVTGR